jgi:hypothetical protein
LSRVGAEKKGDATMNRQHQIEAAVVLFAGMLYLTGSFLKAILVSISVLVSCIVGFGPGGSFAIAIVSIARPYLLTRRSHCIHRHIRGSVPAPNWA